MCWYIGWAGRGPADAVEDEDDIVVVVGGTVALLLLDAAGVASKGEGIA